MRRQEYIILTGYALQRRLLSRRPLLQWQKYQNLWSTMVHISTMTHIPKRSIDAWIFIDPEQMMMDEPHAMFMKQRGQLFDMKSRLKVVQILCVLVLALLCVDAFNLHQDGRRVTQQSSFECRLSDKDFWTAVLPTWICDSPQKNEPLRCLVDNSMWDYVVACKIEVSRVFEWQQAYAIGLVGWCEGNALAYLDLKNLRDNEGRRVGWHWQKRERHFWAGRISISVMSRLLVWPGVSFAVWIGQKKTIQTAV